jgi:hypothetical protein
MAETTARSQNSFDPFNMTKGSRNNLSITNRSPGKSVYMASERNSIGKETSQRKFGGHVAAVRALKHVHPYMKKQDVMNSTNSIMMQSHRRFNSLQPKKISSRHFLPKI